MPKLSFLSRNNKKIAALFCTQLLSLSMHASSVELSAMYGHNFSPKLSNHYTTSEILTTDEANIAVALSWQDTSSGQGQVLFNYISRDFIDKIDQSTHSFETLYAHFNGVTFLKNRNYITTVGIGIGMAYFDSGFDQDIYPSITITVGSRHDLVDNLTFITELRVYATLTQKDDPTFCQNSTCVAYFNSSIWTDKQISMGFAYRF